MKTFMLIAALFVGPLIFALTGLMSMVLPGFDKISEFIFYPSMNEDARHHIGWLFGFSPTRGQEFWLGFAILEVQWVLISGIIFLCYYAYTKYFNA